ncbi:excinuclease ABC subunit UvrC [Candidatus Peregrinibacteria bacterium]|nr:excinuclease ABC subunit UvrC [Candidatus Peregrinibacteria bacterium]
MEITKLLKKIPKEPGIYKMIDKDGRIIYVGKAKDLSKRVKQYFQNNYNHSTRTKKLLENVANIETISVDSELEAMLLEHNLIKQLQPKYNVIMKDDKTHVYIKITKEDFPRIQIVRQIEKDNARYIGPKSAAHKVKETLKVIKKIFPFRHCGLDIEYLGGSKVKVTKKVIKYPCLDYYIKRCIAPCIGKCTPEEYQKVVKNVEDFLDGKADNILKELNEKMHNYAKDKQFERAAKVRDKILKVKHILEKQKISDPNREDTDIINYILENDKAYFSLFQVRDGKLLDQENFILNAKDAGEGDNEEVLLAFLKQYYEIATDIPKEIFLPHAIENNDEISSFIEQQSTKKTKILTPKIGTKNKLLEMARKNAAIYADKNKPSWKEASEDTKLAAEKLQKILKLKNTLKRIECYDISHLSGTETVGSMIVFISGAPDNSMYRKFKLRTVIDKPDDYKSMEEVLGRRFLKISREFQFKDYTFKKALKTHESFIEDNTDGKQSNADKQFYIFANKKEPLGFISIREHSEKLSELDNFWLKKSERGKKLGYKILKKAIQKAKAKRIYICCKAELRDYYLGAGFEEIKKVPPELMTREYTTKIVLVYDKIKAKEDKSFSQIPDLIVIDGGKGQLAVAEKVLNELSLQIPHISLAKRLEEIFIPGKSDSIQLQENDPALKLLQRMRDEAHRFAISFNRDLRAKKIKEPLKNSRS